MPVPKTTVILVLSAGGPVVSAVALRLPLASSGGRIIAAARDSVSANGAVLPEGIRMSCAVPASAQQIM